MFKVVRCTTQQLEGAINGIVAGGDSIDGIHHTGGRDWVIISRKADL